MKHLWEIVFAAFVGTLIWIAVPKWREYQAEFDAKRAHRAKKAESVRKVLPTTNDSDSNEAEIDDGAPLPQAASFDGQSIEHSNFDPRAHPEQVYDLIAAAGKKYETVDGSKDALPELVMMLQAIWRTESSGGVGGQLKSRRTYDIATDAEYSKDERPVCNAFQEYEVRDAHKPGHTDERGKWVEGNGTKERKALTTIAVAHGYDASQLYGSCGKSTKVTNRKNFGGCISSMQITPSEWLSDPEYGDKDPYDLYWSMFAVAKRLRTHYDDARRKGFDHRMAILKALSRYYGADPELKYRAKTMKAWGEAFAWYQQGVLREEITKIARKSAKNYIPPAPASQLASN